MKDPYTDSAGVLTNKLNIKDKKKLDEAEASIGFIKLINVDSVDTSYFNAELEKDIHRHIFEDIYDWAGEYRTVPLIKEELVLPGCSLKYTDPKDISKELQSRIRKLNSISWQNMTKEEIANTFAREIALIWRVHPFRDGNTRTVLSFSYLFAKANGFPFDMKTFIDNLTRKYDEDGNVTRYSIRDKFVLASLDEKDVPEVGHLANVFLQAMNNYTQEDSNKFRK